MTGLEVGRSVGRRLVARGDPRKSLGLEREVKAVRRDEWVRRQSSKVSWSSGPIAS